MLTILTFIIFQSNTCGFNPKVCDSNITLPLSSMPIQSVLVDPLSTIRIIIDYIIKRWKSDTPEDYGSIGSKIAKTKEIKGQLGKKKETAREKMIGQSIGYRYDVNLLPDYSKLTPFLKKYIEAMGWDDLNWLEDVHMGYEDDRPAVFCRNANGWVTIPKSIKLPNNQQDRDMIARELLVKFQMSPKHPLVDLKKAYLKF